MKNRLALSLFVSISAVALAQSVSVSGDATSAASPAQTEKHVAELPASMAKPTASPGPYIQSVTPVAPKISRGEHGFFDKKNLELFGVNTVMQTEALLAIQSHGKGFESRGRTLDPFEKHFESYGYGWGSVYRYAGGVGLNMFVAYLFHEGGHHRLERYVPMIAIGHAMASTGYAFTGSRQGCCGW